MAWSWTPAFGHSGLAGEIAHLITTVGRAVRLTEVFGELGLGRPGSSAIDVEVLAELTAEPALADARIDALERLPASIAAAR